MTGVLHANGTSLRCLGSYLEEAKMKLGMELAAEVVMVRGRELAYP